MAGERSPGLPRVALLTDYLTDSYGMGRHYRELLKHLPTAMGRKGMGLVVRRLGSGGLPRRLVNLELPWRGQLLSLASGRPDLLHVSLSVRPWEGAPGSFVSLHDTVSLQFEDEERFPPWTRDALQGAKVVVTASSAAAAEITEAFAVRPDRLVVVHGAVDHSTFRPGTDVRAGAIVVGGTARRKNLATLLQAWPGVTAATGERLRVIGTSGPATEGVDWLGYVSDESLRVLYRQARVMLMPSLNEGFGLPVLEAMASGTPVLASSIPSLREVGGDAARYVDAGDPAAWEQASIDLLRDGQSRDQMSSAGLERAAGFTWQRSADALASAYAQAIGVST